MIINNYKELKEQNYEESLIQSGYKLLNKIYKYKK